MEVIEVGAEDADTKDRRDSQVSDTQWLLGLSHPAVHQMNNGCSNVIRYGNISCNESVKKSVFNSVWHFNFVFPFL